MSRDGSASAPPPARPTVQNVATATSATSTASTQAGRCPAGIIRSGTRIETATMPRNSPRDNSGWSVTKEPIRPAIVTSAVAMPASTGRIRNQSVRLSSARAEASRSGPVTRRRTAETTWWAESMSCS